MARPSLLKNFGYNSIDALLAQGVAMKYDVSIRKIKIYGQWDPEDFLVKIEPTAHKKPKGPVENVTILHEWLHAYEDLVLDELTHNRYRDSQIDWWAHYHNRKNPHLAPYIRAYFLEEGF